MATRFVCWNEGWFILICRPFRFLRPLLIVRAISYCCPGTLIKREPGSRIAGRIVGNTFLLGFSHRLAHLPAKSKSSRAWLWEFAGRTAAVSRFVCYDLTMAGAGGTRIMNCLLYAISSGYGSSGFPR